LKNLAEQIVEELKIENNKTKLVGILNVTPDSFSDGGLYLDPDKALKKIEELITDGADVIDIGAESTKPGAQPIDSKEQIERLKPILKKLPEIPVSVDTRSAEVANFALDCGVQIINDVSGMDFDLKMAEVIARYDASFVIQHSTGDAGYYITYNDVVEDVFKSLYKKIVYAKEKGIKNIIIDPGIGFGKTQLQCLELLNRIEEFRSLKSPIMVGVSRKSMLGLLESNDNNLKDALSLAVAYPLIQKKVDYLRVHNVKLHKQLLNLVM
jgi:dihydropteroate synthase